MLLGVFASLYFGWKRKPIIWILYVLLALSPLTVIKLIWAHQNREIVGLPVDNSLAAYGSEFAVGFVVSGALCLIAYGIVTLIRRIVARET